MEIKNSVKKSVVLLAIASLIPVLATARPGKGIRHEIHSRDFQTRSAVGVWNNPQIIKDLGLTDMQTKKLKDQNFAFRQKQLELATELNSLQLHMSKAFSEESIDNDDVLELAEKISVIRGKMYVQRIESHLAFRKVLNNDQLDKLNTYRFMNQRRAFPNDGKRIGMPGRGTGYPF